MKLFVAVFLVLFGAETALSSEIFHLDNKKNNCHWMRYDVENGKDSTIYKTKHCPEQIVWLKDDSFYFSINSTVYWGNPLLKIPKFIVNLRSAKKGHPKNSELLWGVRGPKDSVHVMVVDSNIKKRVSAKNHTYSYRGKTISQNDSLELVPGARAAGVIKEWNRTQRYWTQREIKLTSRFNATNYDEDLYSVRVLSSRQIVLYNECSGQNCEKLPTQVYKNSDDWRKRLNMIDDGMHDMGYLSLGRNKGLLFKKTYADTQHPSKPFILCENDCEKSTQLELPKSFSDNYAIVKRKDYVFVTNENKGSVGNLYSLNSQKPIKSFAGPMVFWHP